MQPYMMVNTTLEFRGSIANGTRQFVTVWNQVQVEELYDTLRHAISDVHMSSIDQEMNDFAFLFEDVGIISILEEREEPVRQSHQEAIAFAPDTAAVDFIAKVCLARIRSRFESVRLSLLYDREAGISSLRWEASIGTFFVRRWTELRVTGEQDRYDQPRFILQWWNSDSCREVFETGPVGVYEVSLGRAKKRFGPTISHTSPNKN